MRLGITGLLGVTFILSYIVKKFEKQVFVFGIIIVISLIAGPYYSESRFSKYIMVGMMGFASIIFFKILMWRSNISLIRNTAVVSTIIICSGLSLLMFIGYNSLILQTQDYSNTLPRRHFPSMQELHLFEFLHDNVDVRSKKYNVISFLNELDRGEDGVMSKVQAFSGLPYDKLRQSPLTLNSSSLDSLYRHLYYSDARYILLPKKDIHLSSAITKPIQFVIDNFKHVYEDSNYMVLEVPTLIPPTSSSKAKIGLVYNQTDNFLSREFSDARLLQYDNKTFDFKANDKSVTVQNGNLTERLKLLGSKMHNGITIWSKMIPPEKTVNSIEVPFRITSENKNKSNDIQLEWRDADKQHYYVKFSKKGLELYKKSVNNQDKILLKNTEIAKKQLLWYTLKVESSKQLINVYMNNVLKIQNFRSLDNDTQGISKLGLTSHYNDVEFKPLKIGTASNYSQIINDKSKYYDYYYPVSLLALSKSGYDIFNKDDSSIFSKDVILVSDSIKLNNDTLSNYLDYVREGGKLILISSYNSFSELFHSIFSLKLSEGKEEPFTHIAGHQNQNVSINVTGSVHRINIESLPDVHVIASYRNNKNEAISPFIITKDFSGGGKIVLVNSRGYFNSISNLPRDNFFTLSDISKLLPIEFGKGAISQNTSVPLKAFIGVMQISGKVTLNSSSLSTLDEDGYPNSIVAPTIRIINKSNDVPIIYNNVSIKNLKLKGGYGAAIYLKGPLELPDITSEHDYINMRIPNDFNLTINLSRERPGYMEIVTQNHSSVNPIIVDNGSIIELYKIRSTNPLKSVPVLLKNPEMSANGHISIENANLGGYLTPRGKLNTGAPLELQGPLDAKFGFIDNYDQHYRNATKTRYITYLQSLELHGGIDKARNHLLLPGQISSDAKAKGHDLPLIKILSSSSNIAILTALIGITIIVSKLIWRKKNF
jgi:hypothetical protein